MDNTDQMFAHLTSLHQLPSEIIGMIWDFQNYSRCRGKFLCTLSSLNMYSAQISVRGEYIYFHEPYIPGIKVKSANAAETEITLLKDVENPEFQADFIYDLPTEQDAQSAFNNNKELTISSYDYSGNHKSSVYFHLNKCSQLIRTVPQYTGLVTFKMISPIYFYIQTNSFDTFIFHVKLEKYFALDSQYSFGRNFRFFEENLYIICFPRISRTSHSIIESDFRCIAVCSLTGELLRRFTFQNLSNKDPISDWQISRFGEIYVMSGNNIYIFTNEGIFKSSFAVLQLYVPEYPNVTSSLYIDDCGKLYLKQKRSRLPYSIVIDVYG